MLERTEQRRALDADCAALCVLRYLYRDFHTRLITVAQQKSVCARIGRMSPQKKQCEQQQWSACINKNACAGLCLQSCSALILDGDHLFATRLLLSS